MTTDHHTPHPFGAPVTAAQFNSRLGELDLAIGQAILAGFVGASSTLDGTALAGQPVLSVASVAGFTAGDYVLIGHAGSGLVEGRTILSVNVGANDITLTTNLTNTHTTGTPVSRSPLEVADARGIHASLPARLAALEASVVAAEAKIVRRAADRVATLDAGTNGVPVIVAHRGYTRSAPENTLEAIRAALAAGAKVLELDIVFSYDGVPMLMHDNSLSRTTPFGGLPEEYSSTELRRIDAGSWYNPSYSNQYVPALRDVLDEFGGKCTMILEVKANYGYASHALAANAIADVVADYELEDFTVLASFNDLSASSGGDAWTAHGIPLLRYSASPAVDGTIGGATPAAHVAGGYRYVGLGHGSANFGPAATAWAAAGARVLAWTVNTRRDRDVALAASAGLTGIITDDPQYLRKPNLASLAVGARIPFNAPNLPEGTIPFWASGAARLENPPGETNEMGTGGQDVGMFGWPAYGASQHNEILVLGRLGWGGAGIGKITAALKFNAAAADLTRWAGLDVYTDDRGHVTTAGTDTSTGYRAILRANGDLQVYRINADGSETLLGSDLTAANLVVGTVYVVTLEVTATNIIATGNGVVVNVADASFRALTVAGLIRDRMAALFDDVRRIT